MKTYIKYLKSVLKILTYSLFIFTPFVVNSKTSEIFEFNKISFIYLISGFSLGLFIPVFVTEKEIYLKKIKKAWIFFLISSLFIFIFFLSFLFSIDKYVSFYGYYGRFNGGLLSYLAYIWLSYLVYFIFDQKQIKKLLKLSYFISLLIAIEAILTRYNFDLLCFFFSKSFSNTCWTVFFNPAERIFGFLGQPNWLASYLAINLIIGYFYFINFKGKKRLFYFFSLIILFFALLFTRSFSGILASFTALILFLIFLFSTKKEYLKQAIVLLASFTIIFLFLGYGKFVYKRSTYIIKWLGNFYSKKQNQNYKKQITNTKNLITQQKITDSFKIRLIVWRGAFNLWKRYPLLGIGPETFGIAYYFTRPLEHNYTSEWDYLYNKAHNEFLNFLATTGIFGFLAYFILVFYPILYSLRNYLKTKKQIYLLFFLIFIVIHITNFAGFSTTLSNLYLFILSGIIFTWDKKVNFDKIIIVKKEVFIAFLGSIVILISTLVFLGKFYFADLAYAKGKLYENLNDYYNATNNYNLALKRLYNPIYADKLSFSTANLYYLYKLYVKDSLNNSKALKDLSIYFSNRTIKDSPYNILYYKTKAKDYFLFYQADSKSKYLDKAILSLKKAIKLAPTEPRVYYLYTYLKFIRWKDNPKKLKEVLNKNIKHLLTLKYDYPQAHILKAKILYVYLGKENAIEYLKDKAKELNNLDLQNAIKKLNQI